MINDFFLITLIFSILNLFLIIFFEKKYDLISIYDKPNIKLKNHKKRMPVYGGILFFINFIIFSILDILVFNVFFQVDRFSILLIISTTFIFFIGILDDKNDLSPFIKTVFILIFSSVILLSNNNLIISKINLDFIDTIYLYNFSFFFTFLCVFVFINSYNMLDGADLNIGLYNFFVLFFLYYKTSFNEIFLFFLIINSIFLFLNFYEKTFFGNNGSYFFSFFLSIILIFCFKNYNSINEEDIILVTIFPIVELIRLFFTRIIKNKSPFLGDNNHFHHISSKLFGKIKGILFCQLYIVFCFLLDFIFSLSLWILIVQFIILYTLSIYFMNKRLKN